MSRDVLKYYVRSHERAAFRWGAIDCLTFANGAMRCVTGAGFCDDWLGEYDSPRGAAAKYLRLRKLEGKASIIEGVDDRLRRVDTLHPRDGMICAVEEPGGALGWAFGVVSEGLEWYLSEHDGLISRPPNGDAIYWEARE